MCKCKDPYKDPCRDPSADPYWISYRYARPAISYYPGYYPTGLAVDALLYSRAAPYGFGYPYGVGYGVGYGYPYGIGYGYRYPF